MTFTRRGLLVASAGSAAASVLSACSTPARTPVPTVGVSRARTGPRGILQSTYDGVVLRGPVADPAAVAASAWATRIKAAGYVRRAGTVGAPVFSLRNPMTGRLAGFDAGISDLLAHYITGRTDVGALSQVTQAGPDAGEKLLAAGSVDILVGTYTITVARAERVAFAGPYYASGTSILVRADNTSISSVADLKGKALVTQSDSTGVLAIQRYVPGARATLYADNDSCVRAVEQGSADAYVLDEATLLAAAAADPDLVVLGPPFTTNPYGIGLSRSDPSAKTFVNTFLQRIVDSDDWLRLWHATVGVYSQGTPSPPVLGSASGS